MQLELAVVFAFVMTFNPAGFACECGSPSPACAYISVAPVVFIGTPVYSNDDGSGTFIQQTLYKFTVDEIFKGLPEGTKAVWVDPGSYTSCYADYEIGTRLLVFASEGKFVPFDTAAMTVAKPAGKLKPLPPGFDPKMPVYYAPECTGTRDAASAADDITWLRLWKKGDVRTRIQGLVLDGLDWPLPGVRVIANGRSGNLAATTDAAGAFSIEPVQPGKYDLNATLAGYDLPWKPQVEVFERSCGYTRLSMGTAGALSGTVIDKSGGPVAGVELNLARMRSREETFPSIHNETTTANGFFRYENLPGGDYLIGVNLRSQPNVDTPYARTYAPGVSDRAGAKVFHLAPGQKLSHLRLQLPPRLRLRKIHVAVQWPDGRSAGQEVSVEADHDQGGLIDFENTKKDGTTTVQCFVATGCTVKASMWLTKLGENATPQRAMSWPRQIGVGEALLSITLTLTETKSGWDQ
jgi:hypothetical protein